MAENTKKPAIRFAGFTEAWEQRKLGEIYQVNNERNEGQYPVEKTLSIATMTFNQQGNGADDSSLSKYKVLRVGDLAFEGHTNREFRYGRFVLNNLENGIMSPRFTTLRPIIEQDFSFWEYYIHSERIMRSKLVNATKAGTMMNELVPEDLFKQMILMPAILEQHKIGEFFKHLDNLITLHQRKYDKLTNAKKSMLEKMFPKNGSNVPEIRFKGFTEAWEQRKLGEIYQVNNERNEGQYPVEKTLSIATMTFNQQGNGADDSSLSKYKVLRVGDLAFEGHTNREFRYGRFVLNNLENGIMSPRFTTLRPIIEQDFSFWEYYIHSERIMRSKLVNATKAGTMMNELVPEDLFKQMILMPAILEQHKIGEFFKHLDNLITLHQRKLEKLKNIKKSMLEKMFI